jgi:hypothetical protein
MTIFFTPVRYAVAHRGEQLPRWWVVERWKALTMDIVIFFDTYTVPSSIRACACLIYTGTSIPILSHAWGKKEKTYKKT